MKFIKNNLIILIASVLIFLIVLFIFNPIFTATNLIFPYSLSKFDIIVEYPIVWKYIKIIYLINCFITIYLTIYSFSKFILTIKIKIPKKANAEKNLLNSYFSLLLGTSDKTSEKIYIQEKGLYQNILVTGTIGSRKNRFCNVSFIKTIIRI
ncbi:MAG: hypothetical protein IJB90_00790 [Clostridia bacterium]|nr:hypothetical protein [Clostridia bacterium]